ncbi:glycosyltransferase [Cyanobium sp. WAJ14-Wanaka]|uniref:glycosyltransferase n=1 Tax=Cyanobium sp. WAJ14-Wanaka TaxID=2823725 RepID=UPI0020CE4FA3|nr:nucleotide disphospho-sugar-binding domain-containing protein [Cyanobium sp. WAJ14-Wanaka]MCP9775925.1 glycosyl transferase family 1 [Cyanobium sp. WAJ14-Wanaka]
MTHRYGLVSPPAIGHLNPMVALGMELQRRGHDVVVFTVADGARQLADIPLEVMTIGSTPFPPGAVEKAFATLGKLNGLEGLNFSVDFFGREQVMLLNELPQALTTAGIDLLLVDQLSPAAGTVAEMLGLRFFTICNALPVNREAAVPPYFTGWRPSRRPWARWRNQLGNALLDRLTEPLWRDLQEQRKALGLVPHRRREEAASPLLQLAQLPQAFDFPREKLAPHFHYVGRLADPSGREPLLRDAVPFPWERLDGRSLIYASLGTLQNGLPEIFAQIAAACAPLEAQLVISLGNPRSQPLQLPGNPLVVAYAPHQRLIERANLVITHAGLNTTLTALGSGVPVLAIPITNEQPGIAARLAASGAGQVLPVQKLGVEALRAKVAEMLGNPSYREQARRLQAENQAAGGVVAAADLVEAASG